MRANPVDAVVARANPVGAVVTAGGTEGSAEPRENAGCGVLVDVSEKVVAVAGAVVVKLREKPVGAAVAAGAENPVDKPAKLGVPKNSIEINLAISEAD